jgi:hypothetical protein
MPSTLFGARDTSRPELDGERLEFLWDMTSGSSHQTASSTSRQTVLSRRLLRRARVCDEQLRAADDVREARSRR